MLKLLRLLRLHKRSLTTLNLALLRPAPVMLRSLLLLEGILYFLPSMCFYRLLHSVIEISDSTTVGTDDEAPIKKAVKM